MFNAMDTETSSGYCKIIADRFGYKLVNSFEEAVNFLLSRHKGYVNKYWSFNLLFDRDSILKYLPRQILELFLMNGTVEYRNYTIQSFGKKIFTIKDKYNPKHPVSIVDISQFFNTEKDQTLNGLSKKFLGIEKMISPETENLKNHQLDWDMDKYIIENEKILGEYCRQDADLTAKLAEKVENIAKKIFPEIDVTNVSSSAQFGERMTILSAKGNYPQMVHKISANFARDSYHGGMFITMQRGSFGAVYDLDISSAYPYHMKDLPNWSNGRFNMINNPGELLETDYYGWVICEFDCPWIPYRTDSNEYVYDLIDGKEIEQDYGIKKIYYPSGKRTQTITLLEYQFIKKWGFSCNLITGWIWRQTKEIYEKPFSWINGMYLKKQEMKEKYGKESMEYMLTKIAMNGAYGKTAQMVGKPKLQNWYYASYITAAIRIQVADFILNHKIDPINIATDGLLFEQKGINLDDLDTGFGGWDKEEYEKAFILGNGMYQLMKKDKFITKMRGITNKRTYDILSEVQKHQDEKVLYPEIKKEGRPVHLSEAIKHWKVFDIKDINCWKKIQRKLDPSSDTKRKWNEFKSFRQLLEGNERSGVLYIKDIETMRL